MRQFWNWIAGWLPSLVTGLLNGLFGTLFRWLFRAIAWFFSLFSQGWLRIFTGLIVGTITAFFGWLGWVQWKKCLNRKWLKKLPPMERLYQQMLQMWACWRAISCCAFNLYK